jgi:hypothetical protein
MQETKTKEGEREEGGGRAQHEHRGKDVRRVVVGWMNVMGFKWEGADGRSVSCLLGEF